MKKIQSFLVLLSLTVILIISIFTDSHTVSQKLQGDRPKTIVYKNQMTTTTKSNNSYGKILETMEDHLEWLETYKLQLERYKDRLTEDTYNKIMSMWSNMYELTSKKKYHESHEIYLEIETILDEETEESEEKILVTLEGHLEWIETYRLQLERIKHQLTEKTYNKIMNMWNKMYELTSEEKHDESNQIYLEIEKILEELCVNYGDQNFNPINVYKANDGKIDFGLKRDEFNLHKVLWDRVLLLYPEKYLNKVRFFKIVVENDKQETLAAVRPLNNDRSKFELIVTLISAFDADGYVSRDQLNNTLIHELGHIITLDGEQVDTKNNEQKNSLCIDNDIWFYNNSYMYKFYNTFWKEIDKVRLEALKYRGIDDEKSDNLYNDYVIKYSDQFFSSYVMSTPIEDIAESFARFILDEKPKEKSILDRKKLFFYQYEELVEMRQNMRERIEKAGL